MVVAFLAACATNTSSPPPSLASVEARISFLRNLGVPVQGDVVERDRDLEFPLGECGAVLHFFDQKAELDVFKDDPWSLEVLYGDDIKNAGKTAKTQVCNLGKKSLTPPSESSSVKVENR
jgi:hypothetical protein